jgi:predicted NBD/HSP70 family sugar kinase
VLSASGTPVRQSTLRAHNLALALRTVANSVNPPSRAAVAAATGLTRATVSALVDELIAGGLLTEVSPAPRTGAGRPAVGLRPSASGPAGLGLEINVDYRAACVVDLTGAVRHRIVEPGDQSPRGTGPASTAALAGLAALAEEARRRAEADRLTIAGAALAVPGLVADGRVIRVAPNLGWQDVDTAGLLGELPLTVENEANLAALGELAAAEHSADFVYVSGEIGIGAGIVLGGELYRGARGWSGEIGHIPIDPAGPSCRCGARGCLEQYAGQEAMLRTAGVSSVAELATADLTVAGTALGTALSAVVNLLDVDTVVLGGIYAPLLPRLREPIIAETSRRVLTAGWSPIHLRAATLGPDAAVRGAAGAVLRTVLDNPTAWLHRTP